MKKLGILLALTLTSGIASANTCDINLKNMDGDVVESFTAQADDTTIACSNAAELCEEAIETEFGNDETMVCDLSNSTEKMDVARRCTVRLTGPFGRWTLRRYTAYGYFGCRRALNRCYRDADAFRGANRCVIQYHGNRGDRRPDRRPRRPRRPRRG